MSDCPRLYYNLTGSAASLSAAQLSPPLVSSMYQVGRVRDPMYRYRVGSVSVCVTALLAPGFLHTGRGGSKPPGSPGWRPLPGSKAFGLQQPTGYHLFTIHSYLLPSPTQVGDAGRVRELTYWYRVGSVFVCVTALPCPRFPPHRQGRLEAARVARLATPTRLKSFWLAATNGIPPIHHSLLPITFAHAGGRCRAG